MRDSKSTVLLVEDDTADQEIILRVVQESGFSANVDIVSSGNEAIEYLFKKAGQARTGRGFPDLIFLDLNLPGMSGFEILE
ncbi:MAG: response regulator, partial [Oricola sp.]|nr:response regulator [Oricola sp.]